MLCAEFRTTENTKWNRTGHGEARVRKDTSAAWATPGSWSTREVSLGIGADKGGKRVPRNEEAQHEVGEKGAGRVAGRFTRLGRLTTRSTSFAPSRSGSTMLGLSLQNFTR